ncbi:response regulator transcription factor [Plantactinospora veratri]
MASRGQTGGVADDRVITVRGEDELVRRAGHLFAGARTEFVCAATDLETWSRTTARMGVAAATRRNVPAGLAVRKLYTPAALVVDEQRAELATAVASGVRVRICAAPLPHETIVIDRKVMILAGAVRGADREFTVTTVAALIEGVHALFEAAWDAADEVDGWLRADAPRLDPTGRKVLRALASGLTDEAAARRLGMPLRTYRRRVAELLRELGSESRFQAGLRAGTLGLDR